jgi:phosphonate transport system substrate-binding protein
LSIVTSVLILISLLLFTACDSRDDASAYRPVAKEVTITTYKIGIHPYLNSKKMYRSYRPILDLVESKVGGVTLVLETSASYAEYNAKLYRGDFDISLPNPFQTYNALSHGYKVVAKMKPDSVFKGIFVARKEFGLKDPAQLKGKSVSFPAPTALAATMMPLYFLHEHGIDVKKELTIKYVGSQYSSILNAYSCDTTAAATWPPPWEAWAEENPKKAQEMEIVWQTEPLINNGFVVKKEMDPEVVRQLVNILVQLDQSNKGKKLLNNAGFEGFAPAADADYEKIVGNFIRKYDEAIGVPR